MGTLSVVLAVRDEEAMLPGCVSRLGFADEVVVLVDDRSVDRTEAIARESGARVVLHRFTNFADLKNAALDAATGDWKLVVDADERIPAALGEEIRAAMDGPYDAYRIERVNYFYGHRMAWGDWRELPLRLVRAGAARYEGDVHEEFVFVDPKARIGRLTGVIHHFSHRTILENVRKTLLYGDISAHERLRRGAPRVTKRHLYWVVIREIGYRLVWKQGWRDGIPGTIECLYQPLSSLVTHARLWELQQSPSADERYRLLEEQIV